MAGDERAVPQRVAGRGEHLAVHHLLRDPDGRDVQAGALHVRDHLLAVSEAGLVVKAVDGEDLGRGAEALHLGEVRGVADEADFLRAGSEEVRARSVAAPAGVEAAGGGKVVGEGVTELLHPAHVHDGGEGARGQLVRHERHVAAAGAAGGEEATASEGRLARVEFVEDEPERAQGVEALQPAEVVRLRAFDGILGAALEIVHAQRHAVELARERGGVRGAGTVGAAPVVQREEDARARADAGAGAAGVMHLHAHLARTGARGPFLRGDDHGAVALRELGPGDLSGGQLNGKRGE